MTMVAVIGVVIVWGLASPLLKYASLTGPALAAYRIWLGSAALVAYMALRGRRPDVAALRWGVPAGLLFGLNIICFVVGVKLTTVANATIIGALQPAMTLVVAGPWFGERVTRREVACVAMAIVGVAVVIVGSSGVPEWNPRGDAFAAAAVLTFTGYFLISKRARATVGTLDYMTTVHCAAALVVTPVALASPGDLRMQDTTDLAIVLFFALVSGTLGQVVIGWAQRYVDVSLSSLMLLGVPVVAAVAAWPIVGEALQPLQIVGGLIALAAIGAMILRPDRRADREPEWEAVTGSG